MHQVFFHAEAKGGCLHQAVMLPVGSISLFSPCNVIPKYHLYTYCNRFDKYGGASPENQRTLNNHGQALSFAGLYEGQRNENN